MPIALAAIDPAHAAHAAHPLWHGVAPRRTPPSSAARDAAFVGLQEAYRGAGGIVRGDPLAARLGSCGHGGYIDLARGIVAGRLFSFQWHDSFWVPMFQFDPRLLTLREAPRRVMEELHGVFDGWDIAHWYVRANDWLSGQRPLDLLESDLPAVLAAARADRYTVDG
jgi:hypothetical protein